jgi:four helix bundle protein
MKSYRDLDIYKESKRLAIEVHGMSLKLPKFELYEEESQIRRSSKSVTSMIVEGYSRRRYKADFIKYLIYSQSECEETGSATETDKIKQLRGEYDSPRKRINKFTQWVEEEFVAKQQS